MRTEQRIPNTSRSSHTNACIHTVTMMGKHTPILAQDAWNYLNLPHVVERRRESRERRGKFDGQPTDKGRYKKLLTGWIRKDYTGRNDPCPCGALKENGQPVKAKHCHYKK